MQFILLYIIWKQKTNLVVFCSGKLASPLLLWHNDPFELGLKKEDKIKCEDGHHSCNWC